MTSVRRALYPINASSKTQSRQGKDSLKTKPSSKAQLRVIVSFLLIDLFFYFLSVIYIYVFEKEYGIVEENFLHLCYLKLNL